MESRPAIIETLPCLNILSHNEDPASWFGEQVVGEPGLLWLARSLLLEVEL